MNIVEERTFELAKHAFEVHICVCVSTYVCFKFNHFLLFLLLMIQCTFPTSHVMVIVIHICIMEICQSLFHCKTCWLQNPGRLKLQDSSVIFKNLKTGIVEQFPSSDIISANWMLRARGYCLRLVLSNDIVHRFDGFRESVRTIVVAVLCVTGVLRRCWPHFYPSLKIIYFKTRMFVPLLNCFQCRHILFLRCLLHYMSEFCSI